VANRSSMRAATIEPNDRQGGRPDYGFSSASSDGRPSTMVDHEEAIRNFLSLVDPETGYIE